LPRAFGALAPRCLAPVAALALAALADGSGSRAEARKLATPAGVTVIKNHFGEVKVSWDRAFAPPRFAALGPEPAGLYEVQYRTSDAAAWSASRTTPSTFLILDDLNPGLADLAGYGFRVRATGSSRWTGTSDWQTDWTPGTAGPTRRSGIRTTCSTPPRGTTF